MAQKVNQQIVPGNQQPIVNVQQQILQNEDNNGIQLSRAAVFSVILFFGMLLIAYPLATPDPCHAYSLECWGIGNAANIGFLILASIAIFTSGVLCALYTFAASYSDVGFSVLAGIQGCECFACIIGFLLTYRDITKCCVKKSDRVDVNRPDVVPSANEVVVNPANRPTTKAQTKAPKHRPPTKAIPLPDMFFTA